MSGFTRRHLVNFFCIGFSAAMSLVCAVMGDWGLMAINISAVVFSLIAFVLSFPRRA